MKTQSEYVKLRRTRQRVQAIALLGGKCSVCNSTEDLEFDHIDPKTKSFNIGHKLHYSWERMLLPELQKCQLLCVKHHRAKTAAEGPWNKGRSKHGTFTRTYNLGCKCEECLKFRQQRNADRRVTNNGPQTRDLIHGTRAGYLKEKRQNLPHCEACKNANTQYSILLRQRRKQD